MLPPMDAAEQDAPAARFERWVREHKPELDPAQAAADATIAMDWKPAPWTLRDVSEFLFEWCPQQIELSDDRCESFIAALRAWFGFLAMQGELSTKTAVELSAWCRAQLGTFTKAMAHDTETDPGHVADMLADLQRKVGPERAAEVSRSLLGGPNDGIAVHALLTTSQLRPDEVSEARILGSVVDTLALAWDRGRAPKLIETVGTGAGIEKLWRIDHPRTAEMLEAIGAYHPDQKIAKTARKTAIRHWARRTGAELRR